MNVVDATPARNVPWDDLQDAFGPASEVPRLLAKVGSARGRSLANAIEKLCEHVLHQGTIYSASPAAVEKVIGFARDAGTAEREALCGLLTEFASSARQAIADGRAIPCHSGGDPVHGAAIRDAILAAHPQFIADLANPSAGLRAGAAELAAAFPEADSATARLVRERYFVETEAAVRNSILHGLVRVRRSFRDWPEFLDAALAREDDRGNRFTLRHAQVLQAGPDADPSAVAELISTFDGEERFFEAIRVLGKDQELAALVRALDQVTGRDAVLMVAQRLLRAAFDDRRTGWGQTSFCWLREDGSEPEGISQPTGLLLMMFKMLGLLILADSKPKGIPKIEYWGLEGDEPAIPAVLTVSQRAALTACAAKGALWEFRTNLWQLFHLPDTQDGLQRFLAG
jgi:hypothetical protein